MLGALVIYAAGAAGVSVLLHPPVCVGIVRVSIGQPRHKKYEITDDLRFHPRDRRPEPPICMVAYKLSGGEPW